MPFGLILEWVLHACGIDCRVGLLLKSALHEAADWPVSRAQKGRRCANWIFGRADIEIQHSHSSSISFPSFLTMEYHNALPTDTYLSSSSRSTSIPSSDLSATEISHTLGRFERTLTCNFLWRERLSMLATSPTIWLSGDTCSVHHAT